MRMNIYVQDELGEAVKAIDGLNISKVCQEALEAEVGRRTAVANLEEGMERVELYIEMQMGIDRLQHKIGSNVSFVGKEVYYDHRYVTAYLTKGGRIAIHDDEASALHVYDRLEDMSGDDMWGLSHPELITEVANTLGEKHVVQLDI